MHENTAQRQKPPPPHPPTLQLYFRSDVIGSSKRRFKVISITVTGVDSLPGLDTPCDVFDIMPPICLQNVIMIDGDRVESSLPIDRTSYAVS